MLVSLVLPLVLILAIAGVLAGRRRRTARLPDLGPGERVLAVIRPDADIGLSLAAVAVALAGMALVLAVALFGPDALVPLGLALLLVAVPVGADWAGALGRAWVVTERRLIAGPALEVALADLTRVRILPLAVEIEARGARRLRLPALANPGPAGRAIHSAALERLRAEGR